MVFSKLTRTRPGEQVTRTVCPLGCGIGCGILAHTRNGVLTRVEPGDHPGTGRICARGLCGPNLVYHPDRLKYPIKRKGRRGEGKWERISWEEAMDTIASRFKEITGKYGSSSVAFVSTGVGAMTNLLTVGFAGACQGTFILPAGLGDSAGPCADQGCFGSFMWFGEDYLNRFDIPALCLVWGNNPAETEPFKWRRIREATEYGARLIVIDPRFTTTASKADQYLPIRRGTDAALALGMMHVILKRELHDTSFIATHTVGPFLVRDDNGLFLRGSDIGLADAESYLVWDETTRGPAGHTTAGASPSLTGSYRAGGIACRPAFQRLADMVDEYTPARVTEITELPAETITSLAIEYAAAKPAASYRGMGCTRGSFHGDLSFRAINTLAAITGNISFEGHTTVQHDMALFFTHGFPSFVTLLQSYEAITAGNPHPIKALWLARHNLVNQDPNFNKITGELIPGLEFIVAVDMFMTATAMYADIVLPVASFYEFDDLIVPIGNGSHPYLQLQQKVIEPLYEPKSDLDIYSTLAKRLGLEGYLDKRDEDYIRTMLATGHPSLEGITLERLKEGHMPPAPHEVPDFATASGRLEFYCERLLHLGQELPVHMEPLESSRSKLADRYPLSFSQTHPKYRLHTMFTNIAWIRELDPGPVLEINPVDAARRGIEDGDLVRAYNDRGEVRLRAEVCPGIRPGQINVCQGWSPGDYHAGTHQALTHETINPAHAVIYEPNSAFYDVLAEVEKATDE